MLRSGAYFAALLMLVGCSGAASPDIPPSSDISKTEPPVGTPSPPATGKAPGIASGDVKPDDNDDQGSERGNDPKPGDPPKPDDPPSKPDCVIEKEGNNTSETATPFVACVVGKVAGSNDPDFLRVIAPAKVHKMQIEHKEDGKLRYTVFRDKGTWPLNTAADFTNESQEINVIPGEGYLFRLSFPLAANGDGDRSYELKVSFK